MHDRSQCGLFIIICWRALVAWEPLTFLTVIFTWIFTRLSKMSVDRHTGKTGELLFNDMQGENANCEYLLQVVGSSEHGNDTSYSTKVGNFLAHRVTVSFSPTSLPCIPRPVQQPHFPNILRRTIISAAKSETHEGKRRIYTEFWNNELNYIANKYLRYFLHVSLINQCFWTKASIGFALLSSMSKILRHVSFHKSRYVCANCVQLLLSSADVT